MPSTPPWPALVAAAHTLPREMRANAPYVFHPERFRHVKAPTLLIGGSESPAFLAASLAAVHAALPHSRTVVLPGQQHMAMVAAPDLFAHEVLQFLAER